MANQITVKAFGTPNSFARRVQHNPQIAVELLRALKITEGFVGNQIGVQRVEIQRVIEAAINYAEESK